MPGFEDVDDADRRAAPHAGDAHETRRGPPATAGRRVDLHAHTFFSDGQLSPEELVEHALEPRAGGARGHRSRHRRGHRARAGGRRRPDPHRAGHRDLHACSTATTCTCWATSSTTRANRCASGCEAFREERRQRALAIMDAPARAGRAGGRDVGVRRGRAGSRRAVRTWRTRSCARATCRASRRRSSTTWAARHGVRAAAGVSQRGRDRVHSRSGRGERAGAPGLAVAAARWSSGCTGAGLDGLEVWHPSHGAADGAALARGGAGRCGLIETRRLRLSRHAPRRRARRPAGARARRRSAARRRPALRPARRACGRGT